MNKLTPDSLTDQAYTAIKKMVAEMTPGNTRLPPEADLAQMMGISRQTVREALKRLINDGYITSAHGKGTFGHPTVIHTPNRIDLNTDFMKLLVASHKNAHLRVEQLGVMESSTSYCKYMQRETEEVFAMNWYYSADDLPMLYGAFEFPTRVLKVMPKEGDKFHNLTQFSAKYMTQTISYATMILRCKVYEPAAVWMGLPPETALLSWKEILWTMEDEPIGFSRFYVHPDNLPMSVVASFD